MGSGWVILVGKSCSKGAADGAAAEAAWAYLSGSELRCCQSILEYRGFGFCLEGRRPDAILAGAGRPGKYAQISQSPGGATEALACE